MTRNLLNLRTLKCFSTRERRALITLIGEVHDRLGTSATESQEERKQDDLGRSDQLVFSRHESADLSYINIRIYSRLLTRLAQVVTIRRPTTTVIGKACLGALLTCGVLSPVQRNIRFTTGTKTRMYCVGSGQ